MPGPVSDSYDPEFGTSSRAGIVVEGIDAVRDLVTQYIGTEDLQNIVDLCEASGGRRILCTWSERQLRIIRFCLDRAKESI